MAHTGPTQEEDTQKGAENATTKDDDAANPSTDFIGQKTNDVATMAMSEDATEHAPLSSRRDMLKHQIEFYFSRENLAQDAFLVSQMDSDQYVPIELIASFNNVRTLINNNQSGENEAASSSTEMIIDVIAESKQLQLDATRTRVRPIFQRSVIVMRQVARDVTQEQMIELFNGHEAVDQCPPCTQVEYADNGCWYVTFDSQDDAQRALSYIRFHVKTFCGEPIMARLKAVPLARSAFANQHHHLPSSSQPQQQMVGSGGGGYFYRQNSPTPNRISPNSISNASDISPLHAAAVVAGLHAHESPYAGETGQQQQQDGGAYITAAGDTETTNTVMYPVQPLPGVGSEYFQQHSSPHSTSSWSATHAGGAYGDPTHYYNTAGSAGSTRSSPGNSYYYYAADNNNSSSDPQAVRFPMAQPYHAMENMENPYHHNVIIKSDDGGGGGDNNMSAEHSQQHMVLDPDYYVRNENEAAAAAAAALQQYYYAEQSDQQSPQQMQFNRSPASSVPPPPQVAHPTGGAPPWFPPFPAAPYHYHHAQHHPHHYQQQHQHHHHQKSNSSTPGVGGLHPVALPPPPQQFIMGNGLSSSYQQLPQQQQQLYTGGTQDEDAAMPRRFSYSVSTRHGGGGVGGGNDDDYHYYYQQQNNNRRSAPQQQQQQHDNLMLSGGGQNRRQNMLTVNSNTTTTNRRKTTDGSVNTDPIGTSSSNTSSTVGAGGGGGGWIGGTGAAGRSSSYHNIIVPPQQQRHAAAEPLAKAPHHQPSSSSSYRSSDISNARNRYAAPPPPSSSSSYNNHTLPRSNAPHTRSAVDTSRNDANDRPLSISSNADNKQQATDSADLVSAENIPKPQFDYGGALQLNSNSIPVNSPNDKQQQIASPNATNKLSPRGGGGAVPTSQPNSSNEKRQWSGNEFQPRRSAPISSSYGQSPASTRPNAANNTRKPPHQLPIASATSPAAAQRIVSGGSASSQQQQQAVVVVKKQPSFELAGAAFPPLPKPPTLAAANVVADSMPTGMTTTPSCGKLSGDASSMTDSSTRGDQSMPSTHHQHHTNVWTAANATNNKSATSTDAVGVRSSSVPQAKAKKNVVMLDKSVDTQDLSCVPRNMYSRLTALLKNVLLSPASAAASLNSDDDNAKLAQLLQELVESGQIVLVNEIQKRLDDKKRRSAQATSATKADETVSLTTTMQTDTVVAHGRRRQSASSSNGGSVNGKIDASAVEVNNAAD